MKQRIKIISWNVNGIRAAIKKGFTDYIRQENPDILCLQETKAEQGQAVIDLPEYSEYWYSSERKKGYSGTAIFSKEQPLTVINGFSPAIRVEDEYGDAGKEGRVIAAEFEKFFVVSVYTPNSKGDLSRLAFRHKTWDPAFLDHMVDLQQKKPVIFCGDLNVAHTEDDLARPDDNHMAHGFTDEEREGFDNFLKAGFVDTFRMFHKGNGFYTWWSPFGNTRARNVGWRIDYICVSESLKGNVVDGFIRPETLGSDHCPVGIELEL